MFNFLPLQAKLPPLQVFCHCVCSHLYCDVSWTTAMSHESILHTQFCHSHQWQECSAFLLLQTCSLRLLMHKTEHTAFARGSMHVTCALESLSC